MTSTADEPVDDASCGDPCDGYREEELRAAEIKHGEEFAPEDSSVSEEQWRQYHGFPKQTFAPKAHGTPSARPRMRQGSRSRRAPRRARVSRRGRPALRASEDPAPAPEPRVGRGDDPVDHHRHCDGHRARMGGASPRALMPSRCGERAALGRQRHWSVRRADRQRRMEGRDVRVIRDSTPLLETP